MAKSVLTALVKKISDASITVEVLELLQKHKQRFLELLKANSTITDKGAEAHTATEGEKCLVERIEEIKEFQTVKNKATSFIDMCDLIQPGKFV